MFKRTVDTTIKSTLDVTAGKSVKIKYHIPGGCYRIYEGIIEYVSSNGPDQYIHMYSNPGNFPRRMELKNNELKLWIYEPERLHVHNVINVSITSANDEYDLGISPDGKLVYFKQVPSTTVTDVVVGDIFTKQGFATAPYESHIVIAISGNKETLFMENIETGVAIAVKSNDHGLIAKFKDLQSVIN